MAAAGDDGACGRGLHMTAARIVDMAVAVVLRETRERPERGRTYAQLREAAARANAFDRMGRALSACLREARAIDRPQPGKVPA